MSCLVFILSLAIVLLATVEVAVVVGADGDACRVRNANTGRVDRRLGRAVRYAKAGHRLVVTGTCRGRVVIDKDLRIEGLTTGGARPLLRWSGEGYGITVRRGVTARVTNLVVKGEGGGSAGVRNLGRLTLRDVVVREMYCAGGTYTAIRNKGSLRLVGASRVRWNEVDAIRNSGHLVLGGRTSIRDNWGSPGLLNRGTVIMRGTAKIGRHGSWGATRSSTRAAW